MLHGFIFAFFIGPSTLPGWNDWGLTMSIPPEAGGIWASVAALTALAVAPAIIVVKLERAHEFELTPCFRATMRTLVRDMPGNDYMTHVLYYFWTYMYAARAFIMVMYLAFCNASLAVAEKNVSKIILMVLVVAFLLDFDEYVYLTFFAKKDDLGKLILGPLNTVRIGRKTRAQCERVRRYNTAIVSVYQVVLMLVIKTHPWIMTMWSMPLVAISCMWVQNRQFVGQFKTIKFVDPKILLASMLALWLWVMRCEITPYCGEGSRYFMDVPW